MKSNTIIHRIIIAIFTLVLLSLYGSGCGEEEETVKPPAEQPKPSEGVVSYSKDIQPIFNANCVSAGCHGDNPPSGLKLTSYADFVRGGVSGKPFIAGDSANSLIIKRLEGKGGPMMPLGRAPLKTEQIQKIKDWIDAGAKNN